MSYVLFIRKSEDWDKEIYLSGLARNGNPKCCFVPEYALPFISARAAYEWAAAIPSLQEWQVGERFDAGRLFGKRDLRIPAEEKATV